MCPLHHNRAKTRPPSCSPWRPLRGCAGALLSRGGRRLRQYAYFICRPQGWGAVTGTRDNEYGRGCGRSAATGGPVAERQQRHSRYRPQRHLPLAPAPPLTDPPALKPLLGRTDVSRGAREAIGGRPSPPQPTGNRPRCHPPDDTATVGEGEEWTRG